MLVRLDGGNGPIIVNTDHVVAIEPLGDSVTLVFLTGREHAFTVGRPFADVAAWLGYTGSVAKEGK